MRPSGRRVSETGRASIKKTDALGKEIRVMFSKRYTFQGRARLWAVWAVLLFIVLLLISCSGKDGDRQDAGRSPEPVDWDTAPASPEEVGLIMRVDRNPDGTCGDYLAADPVCKFVPRDPVERRTGKCRSR